MSWVNLKAIVRRQVDDGPEDVGRLTRAVRALIYLRDPYDAVMDQHIDLGLQDDREVLRSAARELAGKVSGYQSVDPEVLARWTADQEWSES